MKLFFIAYLSLFIFSSCSINTTEITFNSFFDSVWDFDSSGNYDFNENLVKIENGKASLKALELEHSGSDLNNGSQVGSFINNSKLSIISNESSSSFDLRNILPSYNDSLEAYIGFDSSLEQKIIKPTLLQTGGVDFSNDHQVGTHSFQSSLDFNKKVYLENFNVGLNSFTASVWVNINSYNNWQRILDETNSSGVADWQIKQLNSNGSFHFVITMSNGVNCASHATVGDSDVPLGVWTHLAARYDSSNNTISFFQDGVLVSPPRVCALPMRDNFNSLGFGSNPSNGSNPLDGKLDEVAIWSQALPDQDIKNIYYKQVNNFNQLSPLWTPKWNRIVGYWKMDGNWQDSSGNSNHGTPVGGLTFSSTTKIGPQAGEFTVSLSSGVNLNPIDLTNEYTISSWVHINDFGGSINALNILSQKVGGLESNDKVFQIRVMQDGHPLARRVQALVRTPTLYRTVFSPPSKVLSKSKWHHLVSRVDASQATPILSLFIDGALVGETPLTGFNGYNNVGLLTSIGAVGSGHPAPGGECDDIAVWDVALDNSEISEIYNRQKQKYTSHYDSDVIDLGSTTSSWPDLSWSTSLPFGKELVGDFNNDGMPDNESLVDYPELSGDLSNGLIGYWPFNESAWSGVVGEVKDLSGLNKNGTAVGGASTSIGKFNNSGNFDGVNTYVDLGDEDTFSIDQTGEISACAWFNLNAYPLALLQQRAPILSKGKLSPTHFEWALYLRTDGGVQFQSWQPDGSAHSTVDSPNGGLVKLNAWHHVCVSFNSGNFNRIYFDGTMINESSVFTGLSTNGPHSLSVGKRLDGIAGQTIDGRIDEVAVWSRALLGTEIQQLYRRGANRVKLQVKSCVDTSCECKSYGANGNEADCDGDSIVNALDTNDEHKAEFIGPGGDGSTYYSELFNRKVTDISFNCALNSLDSNPGVCLPDEITLTQNSKSTGPEFLNIDYTQFVTPNPNRYVQYRVILEADENIACGGAPCLPELLSVNLNPSGEVKYYSDPVEIKPTNSISYKTLKGITIDAESCATYQLSEDGLVYKYWDGSVWSSITSANERTTKLDLKAHIMDFGAQFGEGKLFIKFFLESNINQTSDCVINDIDIDYEPL